MNIDEYCDAAKARQNLKSDRQLCAILDMSYATVNVWRQKKSWPNDETMIRLADLAGIDPIDALLDLNIWRAHGPAIAIYTRMKSALAGTAAALVLCFAVLAAMPQNATASPAPFVHPDRSTLYIMENILRLPFNLLLTLSNLIRGVLFTGNSAQSFRP